MLYTKPVQELNIDQGWLTWLNDPEITKFLSISPPVSSLQLKKYIKDNRKNNDIFLAVYKRDNSEYIGNLRIYNINEEDKTLMYGRMIGNSKNQNNGYGSEFLYIICYIAFEILNFDFAYTTIIKKNIRSKKSNLKIGKIVYPGDKLWIGSQNLSKSEIGFVIEKEKWKIFSESNKVDINLY